MNYKPKMKRFAKIIIILFVLLAIIWSATYFFIIKTISNEIRAQSNIQCEQLNIKGFPLNFEISCKNTKFIDGDATFILAKINIKYSLLKPLTIQINATSPLKYSNAFFASKQELRFSSLDAQIIFNGWQLKLAKIKGEKFEYVDLLFGETLIASADNFEINILDNEKDFDPKTNLTSANISISTNGFDFYNFTIKQGQLDFEAVISKLPTDIRIFGNENIRSLLHQWQQAQGEILLKQFSAKDISKNINISGKARLDNVGNINGEFAINSTNIVELIAPNFPSDMQPLIFGSQNDDNSYSQNIIIKDGTIYSGLLPIGQMPALL